MLILLSWCLHRDLGTSLTNLRTLWLARSGLSDLDGISSVSSLKVNYSLASWDKNSKSMGLPENCWKGLRVLTTSYSNWFLLDHYFFPSKLTSCGCNWILIAWIFLKGLNIAFASLVRATLEKANAYLYCVLPMNHTFSIGLCQRTLISHQRLFLKKPFHLHMKPRKDFWLCQGTVWWSC